MSNLTLFNKETHFGLLVFNPYHIIHTHLESYQLDEIYKIILTIFGDLPKMTKNHIEFSEKYRYKVS